MKITKIALILFLLFAQNLFCQFVQNKSFNVMLKTLLSHTIKEMGAKDAMGDTVSVFLDAREKREFDVSHKQNAIWVGYDDFDLNRVKSIVKNKKIIVYCSVGYRSEKISEKLIKAGYTDVTNMVGGIFEWKNLGYSVVDNQGKETEKIHTYNKTWGMWVNKGEKVYN